MGPTLNCQLVGIQHKDGGHWACVHKCTHMHACMYTHACMRAHTHTHTHTHSLVLILCALGF